jgi:hypothetical protein
LQTHTVDWILMNLIGKSYLDVLQNKVSCGHRIDKLEYQELTNLGLTEITKTNDQGDMKEWRVKPGYENQAKKVVEDLKETRGYKIMATHKRNLEGQQKSLLKDSMELVGPTDVWQWCERVKGLGPVAAMTFLAYINPEKCPSAAQFYSYVGLIPKARLKKGERGHFNPEIKGRLVFCCGNTIMHTDPYYYELYKIKKDYYKERPDTGKMLEDKVKGVPAKVNARARMWLTKLIISHAIEIIRKSHGMTVPRHRYYLPPKPEDPAEQLRIIDLFKEQQAVNLQEINRRIAETGMSFDDAKEKLTWPVYEDGDQ